MNADGTMYSGSRSPATVADHDRIRLGARSATTYATEALATGLILAHDDRRLCHTG